MHTTYTGKLVRIRPFADEAEFCGFKREYAVARNNWRGPQWHFAVNALQEWQDFAEAQSMRLFAVDRLDSGELAGCITCGLRWQLSGFTGTGLLPQHWHRGFGREAKLLASCHLFENFAIESLWSDTVATHTRAIAGLQAIGYRYVGMMRCGFMSHGTYEGQVWYQLMRKDWEKLPIRQIVRRG